MLLHTPFKGASIDRLNTLTYNSYYNCYNYNDISAYANKYNSSKQTYLS
jgi:hypothetical protein